MKRIRLASLMLAAVGALPWQGLPALGMAPAPAQPPAPGAAAPAQPPAPGAAPAPPPASPPGAAAPAAPGQGAAAPAPVQLWVVPGGGGGAAAGRGAGPDLRGAIGLVAAAQRQAAAAETAARGEVPQGGSGRQETVWGALRAVQAGLDDLAGLLAARDTRYVPALEETVKQGVALAVAWSRTSSRGAAAAPQTGRRIEALTASLARLRDGFGRAAVRAQSAAPAGAAELAQQRQLAQAARQWQAQLPAVAAAARRQGDGPLLVVLTQVGAQLQQIAAAPATLSGLLGALRSSEDAVALWTANAAFISPAEQQAWQEADTGAADLSTAEETGVVFTADLASGTTTRFVAGTPDTAGGPDAASGGADDAGAAGADPAGFGEAGGGDVAGGEAGGGVGGLPRNGEPEAGATDDGDREVGAPMRPDGGAPDLEPRGGGREEERMPDAGAPAAAPDGAGLEPHETAAPDGSGAGWVVIHGDPDGASPAAAADVAEDAAGMVALQLGDAVDLADIAGIAEIADEGEIATAADEPAAPAGDGADDAMPLALPGADQACRPWQPPAPPSDLCALVPHAAAPARPLTR